MKLNYAKMKEYHLCPKIIGQIENYLDRKGSFDSFCKAHQVTYRYYIGRVFLHSFEFAKVNYFY